MPDVSDQAGRSDFFGKGKNMKTDRWFLALSPEEKAEFGANLLDQEALEELRTLLLNPEQTQLRKLQERLDDPKLLAEALSKVLPEAITLGATQNGRLPEALTGSVEEAIKLSLKRKPQALADVLFATMIPAIREAILLDWNKRFNTVLKPSLEEAIGHFVKKNPRILGEILFSIISPILQKAILSGQDKKLAEVLRSTVENALSLSVKKDPKTLAGTFSPVMGRFIRKSFSSTLRRVIQSLNQFLEKNFSLRGLKWRLQALRMGKSFTDVVLLNNLIYQVEQVLLFHKKTGLLLQHVISDSIVRQNADIVSGMLTAITIQDFVHDSLDVQKRDSLQTMQIGELTVWIEQGSQALLAGVIRGDPSQELKSMFQEVLEHVHLEYETALESFQGDTTSFETCKPLLEACLQAEYKTKKQTPSLLLWILLIGIFTVLGVWSFFSIQTYYRWTKYLEDLRAKPGIIVTAAEKRSGKYFVSGFRDPLAVDPMNILEESNLDSERVVSRWEPYQALYPEFILARARSVLEPPETIFLKFEKGVLSATGSASHNWILKARNLAKSITGITQFQEKDLVDVDLKGLDYHKKQVENQVLYFIKGTTRLLAGQDETIQNLIVEIQKLYSAARIVGKDMHIEITGHTDRIGSEEANKDLSRARAEQIMADLTSKGLQMIYFKAIGAGAKEPLREGVAEADREVNRRVSFRVTLINALN
jgi:OOP family OmpA-OmpF porin